MPRSVLKDLIQYVVSPGEVRLAGLSNIQLSKVIFELSIFTWVE